MVVLVAKYKEQYYRIRDMMHNKPIGESGVWKAKMITISMGNTWMKMERSGHGFYYEIIMHSEDALGHKDSGG